MKSSPTSQHSHRLFLPALLAAKCLGGLPFLNEAFSADPAPTVSIVQPSASLVILKPLDGAVFTAPAMVSIEVVAVDPQADIRHVEFFANDRLIGRSDHWTRDAVIPGRPREHFFDWNQVETGQYRVVARAKDFVGNTVESKPVAISVGPAVFATGFIKAGDGWRYRNDGTDSGPKWREVDYNDDDWRVGRAQLGYGEGDEVTITEGVRAPHPITAYFRHAFDVAQPDAYTQLRLRLVRDDGAVVYLNGRELMRDNMPSGPVTHNTPALTSVVGDAENAFHTFTLPSPGLRTSRNILAVEVHQANSQSSDVSFDLELIADAAIGPQLAVVSIEATTPNTSEPAPNIRVRPGVFTLKRTGNAIDSLTVFLTYEGTAIAGQDYEQLGQFVSFPAGASEVELLIKPFDDQLVEADESVVATVSESPFDRLPDYTPDRQHNSAKIVIHDTDTASMATLEITDPKDGEVFKPGAPVMIAATAIDPKGYIPRLEFFDGDILLGISEITFIRAPDPGTPIHHTFEWLNPLPGEHVLTARAVDSTGNRVVSKPVRINDSSPTATIEITDPKDGEVFKLATPIRIAATAIDPQGYISRVEFFDGEKLIGVSQIAFFRAPDPGTPIYHTFEWGNPPPGEHLLTARAMESTRNRVVSKPVHIAVLLAGDVTFLRVAALDSEATELPPFVDAIDTARFSISRDGDFSRDLLAFFSLHGTAEAEKDYHANIQPVLLQAGQRSTVVDILPIPDELSEAMETVAIRLEDSPLAGAQPTYQLDPLQREAAAVIYDRSPPRNGALEIALPSDGDIYPDAQSIPIIAAAYHPTVDVTEVEFYADDKLIGSSQIVFERVRQGGLILHRFEWKNAAPGEHILTARAKVFAGQELVSSKISIVRRGNDELPVVGIRFIPHQTLEPWPDADFAPGSLEISRTGPASDPLMVFLEVGGTATPGADYAEFGRSLIFPAGQRTVSLRVQAKDDKFPEGDETVEVTLTTPPPNFGPNVPAAYSIDPEHRAAKIIILDNDSASEVATLEITEPKDGGQFPFPSAISISATAIDQKGEIRRVEFYDGAELIGVSELPEMGRPPVPGRPVVHTFQWRSATMGSHLLRAMATASDGRSVLSAPVRIFVGSIREQLVLEIEAVHATAVEVGPDGGPNPAVFKITRIAGARDVAATVFYTVDGTARNGIDYSELNGRLTLPANENSVELVVKPIPDKAKEDEETVVVALQPPPCILIFPPPPECYRIGEHGVARAVIRDSSEAVNQPPLVTILRPRNGSVFTVGETIEIHADAHDPGGSIERLDVFADGQLLSSTKEQEITVKWSDVALGQHTIRARALDINGAEAASLAAKILVRGVDTFASPLHFKHIEWRPDGGVTLQVAGSVNQVCVIEVSSDLINWTELEPVFLPDGEINYVDESGGDKSQRFYRTRIP